MAKLANQSVIPEPVRKAFFSVHQTVLGGRSNDAVFRKLLERLFKAFPSPTVVPTLKDRLLLLKKKKKIELVVCEKPHPECLQGMTSLWMTDRRPAFSEKPISLSLGLFQTEEIFDCCCSFMCAEGPEPEVGIPLE
ncbi:hypothetical protein CDAR_242201 [Caerostris darwini]|uniref:Uncharacterized protein n=1 Tax=Caerostris darwini TaxID=1538125 RepID=A0AAV4NN02_9ARAC|nr:hypothetical protein CDAR_242201 [Caerostris darwini]